MFMSLDSMNLTMSQPTGGTVSELGLFTIVADSNIAGEL
jgi:hypothetical protein